MKRSQVFAALILTTAFVSAATLRRDQDSATNAADKPAPDAAVERTRDTVRMHDDIYKTAVVLITDKYVHSEDDFPAGSAAIALFDAVEKKGWHKVRLLDASGEPIDDANVAKDDFERDAIKRLKSGDTFVQKVITKDKKRFLRAATPIPVVMQKCLMCHPNYNSAKDGEPIGALAYTIPVR